MGMKGFDNRLAMARKEKGFTQEELAMRLGVTPQAVSKWERGVGYPDLDLVYYLCEVLECSADYLLHRDNKITKLTESGDEQQKQKLLQEVLAEPLMLIIGTGLIECLMEENKNQFPSIKALREKLAIQYGILFPVIRIRDDIEIDEYEYQIIAYDQVLYQEIVGNESISFQDICKRIETVTLENYGKILNRQMVQTLVDNLSEKYPAIVKGVIPERLPLPLLQKILAGLIARGKSVRNLIKIVELLEEESGKTNNVNELLDMLMEKL